MNYYDDVIKRLNYSLGEIETLLKYLETSPKEENLITDHAIRHHLDEVACHVNEIAQFMNKGYPPEDYDDNLCGKCKGAGFVIERGNDICCPECGGTGSSWKN